ncbi:hypothetical protein [Pseudovibrio sp. WM33]|uniref:hypothetical protein n=1 Tax=Pseudovibrio sp. WM33 TaxID=1735585 RepID=UPI0007AE3D8F|nr:hypothetical protein [Pseudovibrio sp. WM33]KZL23315.1 hypothetical protein PsWM33_03504 [Pseudovibrio sp. WM33]
MTQSIDQATIDSAIKLHSQKRYADAYKLLALAGDNYAAAAYRILDHENDIYTPTVQALWERVAPGSVAKDWYNVAAAHQLNYLNYLLVNDGDLPSTLIIEESYKNALQDYGYPAHMAIDIVINTATQGSWLPDWYDVLGLDADRISEEYIRLDLHGAKAAYALLGFGGLGAFNGGWESIGGELLDLMGLSAYKNATYYRVAQVIDDLFSENPNATYTEIETVLVELISSDPTIADDAYHLLKSITENVPLELRLGFENGHNLAEMLRNVLEAGNGSCFLSSVPVLLADGSEKPIEQIEIGDEVQSYDKASRLSLSRVSKTFRNQSRYILDVFGLMITPGHVTFCGDGKFAGRHVPIIDILRSDGAFLKADGSMIRAATGCEVAGDGDKWVWTVTGQRRADGLIEVKSKKKIRAGSRFILDDSRDICVLDLIKAANGELTEDGYIVVSGSDSKQPFHWIFDGALPEPEDYILQRSQVTLAEIFAAADWEASPGLVPLGESHPRRKIVTRTADQIAKGKPNIPFSLLSNSR